MQKQKADADIASGKFEKVYLIYGNEPYLVKMYKNRLKKAIIPEQESMNYAYYDSLPEKIDEVKAFADTMPFFGDRRLVILDKIQAFKKDIGLADYIQDIPETATIIFTEEEVDKRSKLYKAISKYGCVMELNKLGIPDLRVFIGSRMQKAGKGISEKDCNYLIESVGDDLNTLVNEADKCIAYSGEKNYIDRAMIDSVCSMQVENKIFDMVDAILLHDAARVYKLYGDLVTLRENSFGIMAVIRNNFNRLLLVDELYEDGCSIVEISSRTKIVDWQIKKMLPKIKRYSSDKLRKAMGLIVDTEYSIKVGNIGEKLGLEIMLANLLEL